MSERNTLRFAGQYNGHNPFGRCFFQYAPGVVRDNAKRLLMLGLKSLLSFLYMLFISFGNRVAERSDQDNS